MGTLTGRGNYVRGRLVRKALSAGLVFLSAVVLFEMPPPVQAQERCTRSYCRYRCQARGGQACEWFIRSCDANGCRCHIYCREVIVA